MSYFILVLLFLFCTTFPQPISADYLHTCQDSGNYTTNGTYHNNLRLLLTSLSNSTLQTGYSNDTKGKNGPNQVFGLAMCRGDLVLPEGCSPCLTEVANDILTLCPNKMNATVMYDMCFLRYGSIDFFGTPMGYEAVSRYVRNASGDLGVFVDARSKLLEDLMVLATNGTFSPPLFSSGDSTLSNALRLYALVQCTRDLTSQSCFECLQDLIKVVPKHSGYSKGSWYLGLSCYVMYDDYLFFTPFRKGKQSPPPLSSSEGTTQQPPPIRSNDSTKSRNTIVISITAIAAIFLGSIILGYFFLLRKKKDNKMRIDGIMRPEFRNLEFEQLKEATCNFSDDNKLGEGGFGAVYEGVLEDGQNVAVKRLRRNSSQGMEELRNEVIILAKLQHRNLVRLIGYCMEDDEMLLVYEYLPKTSLDKFIFDHPSETLDWRLRLKIIEGICRGLLYLHQDSRLMIVHRDLKLSNILLDLNLNPKIADFGLARLFDEDKSHQTTSKIHGTRGYIAPEYLTFGQFSTKSDIYSFGVMALELCTGKKVHSSYASDEYIGLLSSVWQHWNSDRVVELFDQNIADPSSTQQQECILRVVQIALLCVQHEAELRPNASLILHFFRSQSETLPIPSAPAWELQRVPNSNGNTNIEGISNEATRNTSSTCLSMTIPR